MSADLLGTMLGQYELRNVISDDNSVIVTYQGYQAALKRSVAILVLRAEFRLKTEHREALTRGAELIAAYEHPNIVPILDCGIQDEVIYVVMRLMYGGTLRDRLQTRTLEFQETVSIIRQIANALDYVHTLGDVHGDPSTGNIIFDLSGSAYLSDFIFAGFLTEKREGIWGTPLYMAPERWDEQVPTPASDQYALAAIAYQALTGHTLFDIEQILPLGVKHMQEMPPAPQTHRPEIPTAVNEVLFRALAKNPHERYPTVIDFARELEKAVNTAPQHLFISYSRRDKEYATQLREYLQRNSFRIWLDDEIEHGDQWFKQIHEAIKSCAAFLVIMSPDSEQSEWVQKEVLLAKRHQKPIFPLLLAGEEFPLLIDIQFADVRHSDMPGTDFHRRISRTVYGIS